MGGGSLFHFIKRLLHPSSPLPPLTSLPRLFIGFIGLNVCNLVCTKKKGSVKSPTCAFQEFQLFRPIASLRSPDTVVFERFLSISDFALRISPLQIEILGLNLVCTFSAGSKYAFWGFQLFGPLRPLYASVSKKWFFWIKFGKLTWLGGGFDVLEWEWSRVEIQLLPNFCKGCVEAGNRQSIV